MSMRDPFLKAILKQAMVTQADSSPTQKAEVRGLLEPRSEFRTCLGDIVRCCPKKKKEQVWWLMPLIPATQEVENLHPRPGDSI
jgi:hypothetical protein